MKPLVGIVMGSESDRDTMKKTEDILNSLNVPYEINVMSAHRNPETVKEYTQTAADRGLKAIIAGAGLAAHLAGAIAANTLLPVIGVPIEGGPLRGFDALLSTVMMPKGIPVATVAIGTHGARNAAYLAAQIIALNDTKVLEALKAARGW
ncbi:MAG: 5-(carboxyamino)imidazole ribonucleotide mutase [bacterium]|nr:5-(carboxyamino)imidazole ribonucleotide mutase [bacterium]